MTENVRTSTATFAKEVTKTDVIGHFFGRALNAQKEALSKRDEIAKEKDSSFIFMGNVKDYIRLRNIRFQEVEQQALNTLKFTTLALRDEIEKTFKGKKRFPDYIKIDPDLYFLPHDGKLVFAPILQSKTASVLKKEKPDLSKTTDAPLSSWYDIGNLPTQLLESLPGRKRRRILKEHKRQEAQTRT